MEGRLLARARAKQETLRAENRAEEDRRRREIAAKIPDRFVFGELPEYVDRCQCP